MPAAEARSPSPQPEDDQAQSPIEEDAEKDGRLKPVPHACSSKGIAYAKKRFDLYLEQPAKIIRS